MKIIEAMKQIRDLQRKAEDLRDKVGKYAADQDLEAPTYGTEADQRKQVAEWVQAHGDLIKEILRLRTAIQRTNLATQVDIELDGKHVSKSIAEWIHRRRELSSLDREIFSKAISKATSVQSGMIRSSSGDLKEVKVRRYFDQAEYDRKIESYRSEPSLIDGTLEVVNAVTDLIEK